ncbi:MAG TPA: DMT family transporter [Acidimicrobiales bacterium]|nr:DMT family transporter [Acidimicrobiales bacterium]
MLRAHLAVVAAAVLFGTTFVVVKDAIALAHPIPFLAVRFLVGAVLFVPFSRGQSHRADPGVVRAGVLCGAALLAGYLFQTIGLQYTSSSVSAFITYLLVVLVPVLSAVVLRRAPDRAVAAGVLLSTLGLVLLSGGVSHIGKGELLTLGCAFAFAVHILLLAEAAPRFPTAALNAVQVGVVGAVCLVVGLFTGGFGFPLKAWLAAIYTGAAVSAGAMGLQVWGQRRVGANRTSLLLMVEPVSAAILGAALGDHLGWEGALGAALILGGILLAEAPVLLAPRVENA